MMNKITVEKSFWKIFPDAQVNIMILKGLDNQDTDVNFYSDLLSNADQEARQYLTEESFKDNPIVASWRKTYQSFKKKKGARASIEALLKRVDQDKGVGTINPLVDLYNSVSLKFGVPVGGEDLDTIKGDFHLGVAEGGEAFYPLGDDKNEPALPGEVIYYDNEGAICRCLNWRDGKRTMLTENTKNAIMVMEATNDLQKQNLDKAMDDLKELVSNRLKVSGTIYKLNQENPTIEIK